MSPFTEAVADMLTRRSKTLYFSLLAVSIALLAAYFYSQREEISTVATAEFISGDKLQAVSKDASAIDTIKHTIQENHEKLNQENDLRPSYWSTKTTIQAENIIEQAWAQGKDELAKELEENLYAQCSKIEYFVLAAGEDADWTTQKLEDYCEGYTHTLSDEEYNERIDVRVSKIMRRTKQQEKQLAKVDSHMLLDALADMIVRAASADEIDELNAILHEILLNKPEVSLPNLPFPYTPVTYRAYEDAYYVAIYLYSCYKFGGCDAENFKTLIFCSKIGQCLPGWSMYDLYQNAMSANQLENVSVILNYIISRSISHP
ncbi:MAG: hypothetical protein L3J24_14470 [Xanthomonadales bacterium]|nr:hypothetical protein [Xanthomonadales bacterium]